MTLDSLRRHLLSKPGAVEDHPFGSEPHVYKVGGRMFALVSAEPGDSLRESLGRTALRFSLPVAVQPRQAITLKLDPLHGQLLRAQNPSVRPGYHMNKDHWNTVVLDRNVIDEELAEWIDESYDLVVERLPRKARAALRLGT
jgi:predicted DNA-binding protein (MmcQ/YjbR family)